MVRSSCRRAKKPSLWGRILLGVACALWAGLIVAAPLVAPIDLLAAHTEPITAQGQPVPAPELEGGTAWLNSAGALRLSDLRGRIVLLDFWTLCCINCMHTLPDLAMLEAKYPGVLVVIGVHTPKFPHEKESEAIRKAILKYEVGSSRVDLQACKLEYSIVSPK